MPSPLTVITNAASGSNDEDGPGRLQELFARHRLEAHIVPIRQGDDIGELTRRAIDDGSRVIVAAGGDGTVSAVASTVAERDAVLGVLPFGTLNHFAKDLAIPLDPDEAVDVIARGYEERVDVGEVNDHIFINNSSLGLYPTIVREREERQRLGSGKWPAFVRGMLTVLGRYPMIEVRLMTDGRDMVRRTPLVFIGNNEYEIHGLDLGTRSSLQDGQLCIYLTRQVGRLALFWLALRALLGRLRDAEDFESFHTEAVTIVSGHRHVRVATDGEVTTMETPLEYRIRPGALRVILPEKKEGTNQEK